MEMMCESDDDYCVSNFRQQFDTDAETSLPRIVSVISLSPKCWNNEHNSSPMFPASALSMPKKRPLSPSELPSKHKKTNMDCYVVLERLPERLVQAVLMSKVLVLENHRTVLIESSEGNKTVKTEPDELGYEQVGDEEATVPCLNTRQHASTNMPFSSDVYNRGLPSHTHSDHSYTKKTVNKTSVATMTDAVPTNDSVQPTTTSTSVNANIRSGTVERDISVILLKSAQLPKRSASVTDTAQQQDIAELVASMLQKQNVSLSSGNNSNLTTFVTPNKNQHVHNKLDGLSLAAGSEDELRKLLQQSNKAKSALEVKLQAEQAKVISLLAEVTCLRDTVKQLSNNSTNMDYFSDEVS